MGTKRNDIIRPAYYFQQLPRYRKSGAGGVGASHVSSGSR